MSGQSLVTATFLFTDLVDSTAIFSGVGRVEADRLRQDHFRLLRGAVVASGGSEVKNLGDGLMVMFTSPSRAVACAVGMQQAIEHHNRSAAQPFAIRVGISTGEATEEEGDFFGDPVVEAARLCALAEAGQILATSLVRMTLGRHSTQSFAEVGALELKGLPEPVESVEVVWERGAESGGVRLPARLVAKASDVLFGFFGRAGELALLEEAHKSARTSTQCQAVLLSGEAGIGKSSVAARFARAAHAEGAIVLFGHADEDVSVAHQLWMPVCKSLVTDGGLDVVSELAPVQRSVLGRLVPEIAGEGERISDPDMERLVLWEAVAALLAVASQSAPVVVVLDDIHWADTASLQVLRHLITSAVPMDVTLVCTFRNTDLRRGDVLTKVLADLHREGNVSRVSLRGLDDDDLVELLTAAAGHDLDEQGVGLAHALRQETDGNPFFAAELLRHLGEAGRIVLGADGRWSVAGELEDLGLPSSVRDVIGRRVDRLGDDAFQVLCSAAVIGREFDLGLLAVVTDVGEDQLLDLMDAAVTAAVVVESAEVDRYHFAHALTQHSLYDELSPSRRQRVHQRIAQALEGSAGDDPVDLAELAHHWVAATRPADIDKALTYVIRAGEAARDALAPDDAIHWFEQALELLGRQPDRDPRERARLLTELGTLQRRTSHPDNRDTLLEAVALAEQLGANDVLVDAALGYAQWRSLFDQHDPDCQRVIGAALACIGDDATPTRAQLLAALATSQPPEKWRERQGLSAQALETARASGDDRSFVEVIEITFTDLASPDRRTEIIDDIDAAVGRATAIGDPVLLSTIQYNAVWNGYQRLDLAQVDALLAEFQATTSALGLPFLRWRSGLLAVGRTLVAGRTAEAEQANDRALELGLAVAPDEALGPYGGLLYSVRRCQGRVEEISDFFIDAARDNPNIPVLRSAIPAMLASLGRLDETRSWLETEAAQGFDVPFDITWSSCMGNFADVAATLDDHDAARTLRERMAPFADHLIAPTAVLVEGAVARPLARLATILGDHDQAEAWFALAHEMHARIDAPYYSALGRLDHVDLCLTRNADGDAARAREMATLAASTANEFGFGALTARADALLARL